MTSPLVETVRRWPAYHRRVAFTLALLWLGLTLRALWAEPTNCEILCLGLHETFLPCFVFAFLLIFIPGSQWRFRKRWMVAMRPSILAYGGLMMVAGLLAIPSGFTLGKLTEGSVYEIQQWHWNAKLRSALVLQRWSTDRDGHGRLRVKAHISAGQSLRFRARVVTDDTDAELPEMSLHSGEHTMVTWVMDCDKPTSPPVWEMSFNVYGIIESDLIGGLTFRRDVTTPHGDGHKCLPAAPAVG